MPFVDSVLDEPSRQTSGAERAVREYHLPFGVLFTFAIRDVLLADETVADKMPSETAEHAENLFDLCLRHLGSGCVR